MDDVSIPEYHVPNSPVEALDEFTAHEMDIVVEAHVTAEREACARIVEEHAARLEKDWLKPHIDNHVRNIAKAIRERGK